MLQAYFAEIIQEQFERCEQVMQVKSAEYDIGGDRLHNFKQAAHLKKVTVRQALTGMMSKHTVSIYDLCEEPDSAALAVWNEKITDHINYLLLLKAIVIEEGFAPDA